MAARKIHLQANAGIRMAPFAFCASRINGRGKVEFNGRRSYAFMASEIVSAEKFIATPSANRCAHCCDVLRQRRDRHPKTYAAICAPEPKR
jgi:hypothetical protein